MKIIGPLILAAVMVAVAVAFGKWAWGKFGPKSTAAPLTAEQQAAAAKAKADKQAAKAAKKGAK